MSIADEINRLREERNAAIKVLQAIEADVQAVKARQLNAKSQSHQVRLDGEHRFALAKRYAQQDVLTEINTKLKRLHSRRRAEQARVAPKEVK